MMKRRHFYFVLGVVVAAAVFSAPLRALLDLSYHNDAYSQLVLIPLISAFLVYLERRKIFAHVEYCFRAGLPVVAVGIVGFCAGRAGLLRPDPVDHLALVISSLLAVWLGEFICCYGLRALRAASFPVLFLLMMIPVPDFLLNKIIEALQKGSTEVTYALLRLVGAPVLRQGFVFSLPGFNVQVARECSGIRSSVALLIASLLAGHFFLRSAWRKLSFSLMVIPIAITKNAIRIATISLLSAYVDPGFLTGKLHRDGGIPFSIIAVAMLVPLLWLLQRSETRGSGTPPPGTEATAPGEKLNAAELQAAR
ncbi:MAG: exosortase/archaeosortase family protein [Acidobacteriota bacterium]|nr:exosortase/archaeosortase family protein [Acidobacteriota bacterium]